MGIYDNFHDGRRALVTGAASGIGRATAIKLAEAGAQVLAVDINADGLEVLAAEVAGIEPIPADLSRLDTIADLPTDIDILVNVAGIQTVAPIQDFPIERFEFIMRVMLHAPWYLIRQSVPHMYAKNWGRIVNLSSAHGLRASEFKSAYVTAKHGLEGLSKVVALEGGAVRRDVDHGQPGVRPDAARREADRRAGTRPRHARGRGRRQDHAGPRPRQAAHRTRGGGRTGAVPDRPGVGVHERLLLPHRRRLDVVLTPRNLERAP